MKPDRRYANSQGKSTTDLVREEVWYVLSVAVVYCDLQHFETSTGFIVATFMSF